MLSLDECPTSQEQVFCNLYKPFISPWLSPGTITQLEHPAQHQIPHLLLQFCPNPLVKLQSPASSFNLMRSHFNPLPCRLLMSVHQRGVKNHNLYSKYIYTTKRPHIWSIYGSLDKESFRNPIKALCEIHVTTLLVI